MQTDWGARILSDRSTLYDPLSYHYGSVWPLFTGWSSVAAYRYGRPHVGYTALMSNALLTWAGALGYVTELLSGDFATAFGRSSHHQVWSEAMVVAPVLKGLLGIDADEAAGTLQFAPALPATWDRVDVTNVAMGATKYDLTFVRAPGTATARITPHAPPDGSGHPHRILVMAAFPVDARIRRVAVNGVARAAQTDRVGDEQRAHVTIDRESGPTEVIFTLDDEGTDVEAEPVDPTPGASNEGLRLLRAWADARALHMTVEGLGGRSYVVRVRSSHRVNAVAGAKVLPSSGNIQRLEIAFDGTGYVRRDITVPLSPRLP
jgi:hypothetical protein